MRNTEDEDEAQQRRVSRQDEMAMLSSEIARLAQRLADLTTEESAGGGELSAGVRVRMLQKDVCHLRVGTVVGIRSWKGRHWHVKLDATGSAKGMEIWKKEKHLEVLKGEDSETEVEQNRQQLNAVSAIHCGDGEIVNQLATFPNAVFDRLGFPLQAKGDVGDGTAIGAQGNCGSDAIGVCNDCCLMNPTAMCRIRTSWID